MVPSPEPADRVSAAEIASLDRVIHEPARLLIMTVLATVQEADFVFLARETGLTKGNLGAHLGRLEGAGYVEIGKTYRGRVPRTLCRLTDTGMAAYSAYRAALRRTAERMPDTSGVRSVPDLRALARDAG
jgi:DNA-binding transcriptional ArsR family regulator